MGDEPPEPEPESLTFPLQNAPTTAGSHPLQEEVPRAPKCCTCHMPVHCGLRGLPEADDKLWGMARGEFRTWEKGTCSATQRGHCQPALGAKLEVSPAQEGLDRHVVGVGMGTKAAWRLP